MIIVEKQAETLEEGIENLKEGMIADYKQTFPPESTDRMIQEYIDGFELIDGKKFIKPIVNKNRKNIIDQTIAFSKTKHTVVIRHDSC